MSEVRSNTKSNSAAGTKAKRKRRGIRRWRSARRAGPQQPVTSRRGPDAQAFSPTDSASDEIRVRLQRIESGYLELDRVLGEIERRLPPEDGSSAPPAKPR